MSLDTLLIHTCSIRNAAPGGLDAHNNEAPAFDPLIRGTRCRLVEKRERIWSDERGENTVKTVYLLIVGAGADLREHAEVTEVTLEDASVMAGMFVVTEILTRRRMVAHHKTAMLEKVS
jgi:hypothetical protein